jgi:hypothetical protein
MSRDGLFSFKNEPIWLIYFWEWADLAYLILRMSRSRLFNFENEPIWLIPDSHSLFFLIFLVELCRLLEILGLKYSNGTGYSRYSRSSRCPGLLSGARDAERPTSSKCRHGCRLPRGPAGDTRLRPEDMKSYLPRVLDMRSYSCRGDKRHLCVDPDLVYPSVVWKIQPE